ncbi:MAG: ABC transporter ATP-binding protein [Candidatus Hydrogenedentota bacterium]|nr:MAG: ABC transporter ATP-binding protein [Candidatus Hydrogenedentota bacterium]
MISVSNLSYKIAGKTLYENVNLTLNKNSRYGLVGANGSGKSTFLKILSGQITDYDGEITKEKNTKIGVLEQFLDPWLSWKLTDIVLSGNEDLFFILQKKYTEAENTWQQQLAESSYHQQYHEAEKVLSGLGLNRKYWEEPLSALSGGMAMRVLFAKLIFSNPDFMLLDEPTNYLDLPSIEWFIQYLKKEYSGGFVISSHNRDFLLKTVNGVLDVDYKKITFYMGSYHHYEQKKQEDEIAKKKEIENLQKEKERIEAFITRFKAKASKARQAQSKQKQLERIKLPEIPVSSRRYPRFFFSLQEKSFSNVLQVEQAKLARGEKILLNNFSLEIQRGDKVAFVGANGAGKTSLLLALLGKLPLVSGEVIWGNRTSIGFLSQTLEEVSGNMSAYEWLFSNASVQNSGEVHTILGQVLFSREEQQKPISVLSGGEKTRLAIAKIMLQKPNVLFLDEPTNHLDMEAIVALEQALQDFAGTVFFVSHDKRFLQNVGTRFYLLNNKELKEISLKDFE